MYLNMRNRCRVNDKDLHLMTKIYKHDVNNHNQMEKKALFFSVVLTCFCTIKNLSAGNKAMLSPMTGPTVLLLTKWQILFIKNDHKQGLTRDISKVSSPNCIHESNFPCVLDIGCIELNKLQDVFFLTSLSWTMLKALLFEVIPWSRAQWIWNGCESFVPQNWDLKRLLYFADLFVLKEQVNPQFQLGHKLSTQYMNCIGDRVLGSSGKGWRYDPRQLSDAF